MEISVCIFDKVKSTCLATDWSSLALGTDSLNWLTKTLSVLNDCLILLSYWMENQIGRDLIHIKCWISISIYWRGCHWRYWCPWQSYILCPRIWKPHHHCRPQTPLQSIWELITQWYCQQKTLKPQKKDIGLQIHNAPYSRHKKQSCW